MTASDLKVDGHSRDSIPEYADNMFTTNGTVRAVVVIALSSIFLINGHSGVTAESDDEDAVKIVVEGFLAAMGDGNLDALPDMFVSDANIGTAGLRDGSWVTSTMTFAAWMGSLRQRTVWNRFSEPVSEYTIHVEDSMMAFVRADATVVRDGQARSHNIDYFTLVREDGVWKFLSASYVARPIDQK